MFNGKMCQVLLIKDVSTTEYLREVKQKNSLLNLLTSTMSHELLTPISCIISLAQSANKQSNESSIITKAALIMNTGKLVLSQIKMLLDKSLIENSQFILNLRPENVHEIVYDTALIIKG